MVTIPPDLDITDTEKEVLAKGLSFCPTPKQINQAETMQELEKFYRRIKLHSFFNHVNDGFMENEETLQEDDPFMAFKAKKSAWIPPTNPQAVTSFVERCREDVGRINFRVKSKSTNISKMEEAAIRNLKQRDDIVIKPADKGGATVVWRKDLYIAEASRQLSDGTFYRKENTDLTEKNNKLVKQVIKNEINQGNLPVSAEFLAQETPRCSRFYLLPKIHKANNPGRPVISACSCPTEHIAAYLSSLLQPIVEGLPTFVKDTTHALNIMGNFRFTEGTPLLFIMDVKSLYTSIPNNEGLEAL